jgi:iron complex transport system ATP-binding protein
MFIREGGTVILVAHHVHEIPPEVGRGVLLKYCRIIEDSFTGEVLHSRELSVLFDTPRPSVSQTWLVSCDARRR